MRKKLRGFISAFCFTVIGILVFAAMYVCEQQSLMVQASGETRLISASVDDPFVMRVTLLGEDFNVDCSIPVMLEQYRRRYYALLPEGFKLLEQAVCYTVSELNALARG